MRVYVEGWKEGLGCDESGEVQGERNVLLFVYTVRRMFSQNCIVLNIFRVINVH